VALMDLTPYQVAKTDQEIAGFTHALDDAMRIWVEHHPDQPRAVRLGTYAHQLRQALTPDLAYMMLAVAIERLARE
jgi:hypothetical protein